MSNHGQRLPGNDGQCRSGPGGVSKRGMCAIIMQERRQDLLSLSLRLHAAVELANASIVAKLYHCRDRN